MNAGVDHPSNADSEPGRTAPRPPEAAAESAWEVEGSGLEPFLAQTGAESTNALYVELYQIARSIAKGSAAYESLHATALLSEMVVKILDGKAAPRNAEHFMALATLAMRQILIDRAREKSAIKRTPGGEQVPLDSVLDEYFDQIDLLSLDEALNELKRVEPRAAQVVNLRFFAGFKPAESAEVLDISMRAEGRLWNFAKGWLQRRLKEKE